MDNSKRDPKFRLIFGGGVEFSYSAQSGIGFRFLKPDFQASSKESQLRLVPTDDKSKTPAELPSSSSYRKGSIIDIYC